MSPPGLSEGANPDLQSLSLCRRLLSLVRSELHSEQFAAGNHLSEMSLPELRGFSSNVKGIYHELLFAANENSDGDNITAQLFYAA